MWRQGRSIPIVAGRIKKKVFHLYHNWRYHLGLMEQRGYGEYPVKKIQVLEQVSMDAKVFLAIS